MKCIGIVLSKSYMIHWYGINNAEMKLIFPGIPIHKGNSM